MNARFSHKLKLTSILLISIISGVFAQDVILESQMDIDSFDNSITEIFGDLTIGIYDNDIHNLKPLENIKIVHGELTIFDCDHILNLSDLSNIEQVEDLTISRNDSLTNLIGLSNLKDFSGEVTIEFNKSLVTLNGLQSIKIAEDIIVYYNNSLINLDGLNNVEIVNSRVEIESNKNLQSLYGLNSLKLVKYQVRISQCESLESLDGLNNLERVSYGISLSFLPKIKYLDGFDNLKSPHTMIIRFLEQLKNLDGLKQITGLIGLILGNNKNLENIEGIGHLKSIRDISLSNIPKIQEINCLKDTEITSSIFIYQNENLRNLDGLISTNSIMGLLIIEGNKRLTNLDGLSNLKYIGTKLNISENESLTDCCGVKELVLTEGLPLGSDLKILDNSGRCATVDAVVNNICDMYINLERVAPCNNENNGAFILEINNYKELPIYCQLTNKNNELIQSTTSYSNKINFTNLESGEYNILAIDNLSNQTTIENVTLDNITGTLFNITNFTITNSSNSQDNGSISITTDSGQAPYSYKWMGPSTGEKLNIESNTDSINNLYAGEYSVTITDSNAETKIFLAKILDEKVEIVECTTPFDIVVLNDVSASVDSIDYIKSKRFLVEFIESINIGTESSNSRASIIEWSSPSEQNISIEMTDSLELLKEYIYYPRSFNSETAPLEAIDFGASYLNSQSRPNSNRVLILATDATIYQIPSSAIDLAQQYKSSGMEIITIGIGDAHFHTSVQELLRKIASQDELFFAASNYDLLTPEIATSLAKNYLCPIEPGGSYSTFFKRDGILKISNFEITPNCNQAISAQIEFNLTSEGELPIPPNTPITFYENSPFKNGASKIITWYTPCLIPVNTTENFEITVPINGSSNIFAILNDSGEDFTPISLPTTNILESNFHNNIDSIRICQSGNVILKAKKYTHNLVPTCDTLAHYTIEVCNISDFDATGISIADINPPYFELKNSSNNLNGCSVKHDSTYSIPNNCCLTIYNTYDVSNTPLGYYQDLGVLINGPEEYSYFNFNGSENSLDDIHLSGQIICDSKEVNFSKSASISETCDDSFIQYKYTINNELDIPLQGIILTDMLPAPCSWVYQPYGMKSIAISDYQTDSGELSVSISYIEANSTAEFYMDIRTNTWDEDGIVSSLATLSNLPYIGSESIEHLHSNTTSTAVLTDCFISESDDLNEIPTELNVIPNPSFSGRFRIEHSLPCNNSSSIKIFDLNGRLAPFVRNDNKHFEIMQPGMYIIHLSCDSKNYFKKLIVVN